MEQAQMKLDMIAAATFLVDLYRGDLTRSAHKNFL